MDPRTAKDQKYWFRFDYFSDPVYFCHTNVLVCFYYNASLFSFNFPVDEYEEECVPSGGFAYEKVSKNLHLISADTLFSIDYTRTSLNQPENIE